MSDISVEVSESVITLPSADSEMSVSRSDASRDNCQVSDTAQNSSFDCEMALEAP